MEQLRKNRIKREKERKGRSDSTPSKRKKRVEYSSQSGSDSDSDHIEKKQPVTLADILPLQIRRDEFEDWCYREDFENALDGCFARISVGVNDNKEKVYRVVQIHGTYV